MSNESEAAAQGSSELRGLADVASQTARALFRLRELRMHGEFGPGERMAELPLFAISTRGVAAVCVTERHGVPDFRSCIRR